MRRVIFSGFVLSIALVVATFDSAFNRITFADDPAPQPVIVQPTISIPAEIKGVVGQFIEVPATTNGKTVKWAVLYPSTGLNLFPMDLLKDTKTAVAVANADGTYYLHAWTALNNIPSDLATCKIIIGNPVPPQPIPVPPGPNPPQPIPPGPNPPPTPVKLSVLFVDEHSDYGTDNYKSYLGVINSTKVRAYLNAHCNSEAVAGSNTSIPTWRKWDQNTDISKESASWQKLFSVKRDTLPWLVVADSQGNVFYSGKVPASESDTITLLQKYGG